MNSLTDDEYFHLSGQSDERIDKRGKENWVILVEKSNEDCPFLHDTGFYVECEFEISLIVKFCNKKDCPISQEYYESFK